VSLTDDFVEVYAVPGKHSIIDSIDPKTGLTQVYGHTEDEVRAREPLAVRMLWEDWRKAESARQHTPITWQETTRAKYWEMLEVLPPALWIGGFFLVGEPYDHDMDTGAPRFQAYQQIGHEDTGGARYFVASRPMTRAELRAAVERWRQ